MGWAVTGVYFAVLGASFAVVSAPALNPVEGDSLTKFTLTMTCSTPATTIYYTLNGAEPTQFDLKFIAGFPITIDRNFTVKAKAWTTTEQSSTTTAVYTLTGDIAAGTSHSLALKSPGGVWAWGLKTDGRLGNNQTSGNATVPLESKYLSTALVIGDAQMVAAGKSHSVVLKAGGTVWSYGLNTTTGALGDNTTVSKAMAVQVRTSTSLFLTSCVAVAAGDGYGGALRSNGGVYTWGDRTLGRLGNSTTITGNSVVAVPVNRTDTGAALGGINRIAFAAASGMAKEASAYEQSGQLGQVWVWGANTSGQLG